MKDFQKLELVFGLASSILYSSMLVNDFVDRLNRNLDPSSADTTDRLVRFSVFLTIAFVIAAGSYLHAARKSSFGFYALVLSAGLLFLIQGIILFSGAVFYAYGFSGGIIRILPGVFAAFAIYFAVRSRQASERF